MRINVFVEKKQEYSPRAKQLKDDFITNLDVKNLDKIRVLTIYSIDKISKKNMNNFIENVLFESNLDSACFSYDDVIKNNVPNHVIAYSYLPAQYDQRADSAVQIAKLFGENKINIKVSNLVLLYGKIKSKEVSKIKSSLINAVDSEEISIKEILDFVFFSSNKKSAKSAEILPSNIDIKKSSTKNILKQFSLSMSVDDFEMIKNYFNEEEKRLPTETEIKVLDTYWSDHCRHTTFLTELMFDEKSLNNPEMQTYLKTRKEVYDGDRKKPMSLMDIATIGTKYLKKIEANSVSNLDESEEINACSFFMDVTLKNNKKEKWHIMFKNETHNHPTEIEPFGGAATCLGGAIRDPLSGRSYVYQAMRVTGAADYNKPAKMVAQGKLPQRQIITLSAKGYSSYGNQIGLATGQVVEIYNLGFEAKRMEVGAVIGANKYGNIIRKVPENGDVILLIGGKTGRDGIGGATGSSKSHKEKTVDIASSEVQKGNPVIERALQRLFNREEVSTLIKRCNDFGAGGISVAVGELADGIDVYLDNVLKKYEDLTVTEIAISESQERMAVVVDKKDASKIIKYSTEENLECTQIAVVTDTNRFRMFYKKNIVLDLSRDFINTNGAKRTQRVQIKNEKNEKTQGFITDYNKEIQLGLSQMFDSTIGKGTVIFPFGGKQMLTPQMGMVAKVPTDTETDSATIMTYGLSNKLLEKDAYMGAVGSVVESVSKVICLGGKLDDIKLSFQEYFGKLYDDTTKWGNVARALLGALDAQINLKIPAIGGKDSMSGTYETLSVPPTLISFACCPVDSSNVISAEYKRPDSTLVLFTPKLNNDMTLNWESYISGITLISKLIEEKKVLSASVVNECGIGNTIKRAIVGNSISASINYVSDLDEYVLGGIILEMSYSDYNQCPMNLDFKKIGTTTMNRETVFILTKQTLSSIKKELFGNQETIFRTGVLDTNNKKDNTIPFFEKDIRVRKKSALKSKPTVFIPNFPGTNCEMDSKSSFEKAGAIVKVQNVLNLNETMLQESINETVKNIKQAQILMIPGGFSFGDEPDGSAKFIVNYFKHPKLQEAVNALIKNRDGLILGICNGFQALIKLGLVPFGEIRDLEEGSPGLTNNVLGEHISKIVRVKKTSELSPWLKLCQKDVVYNVPISHGEGRFFMEQKLFDEILKKGQVAFQYVDDLGVAQDNLLINPNGSFMNVESITSPCGRVLGKMGHSERIGKNLYKNVIGEYDIKLFEAGVKYFK